MVNNKLFVLDEGDNKMCPEVIEMKKPQYYYDFEFELCKMNIAFQEYEIRGKTLGDLVRKRQDREQDHERYQEICEKVEEYRNNEILHSYLWQQNLEVSKYNTQKICKYYNIIPFTPSVMINISPDWEGIKRTEKNKVNILKGIIDSYMKEGWYDNWQYVIECGSEGDHIHAHIVAHMNITRLKSTETHLAKGRHSVQLMKYAKKLKGMEGILKGVGIQKTFLRTQELVDDKLKYLIEEHKPQGHSNHHVVDDCFVSGSL